MSDASDSWSRSPEAERQYHVIGALVFAVLGVILFATSYLLHNPVPLTVRGAVIVFVAACIAVAAGFLRLQSPQDFFGGMALILLALTAFVASNDLPGMRGFAFGPGTAPRLFAFSLCILALAVVISGIVTKGPQITPYKMRGVIFITGAILAFAASIRPLGLVIASFSCIVICAAAAEDVKWRETVILAVILTAFCSFLFPYGLNLPFQLWPRFW